MAKDKDKDTSFESILDMPSEDAERPKPLPEGTYTFIIKELPQFGKNDKQTEFMAFDMVPIEAHEDVDATALDEMGGLADASLRHTIYVTAKSAYRAKEFFDDCGVPSRDKKDKPYSIRERAEMIANSEVIGHVKHSPSRDGKAMYASIDKTTSIE